MKSKTVVFSIFVICMLLLSACSQASLPSAVTSPSASRTITVNGGGKVNLQPDIAYINIGIHTEKAGAAEAVSENNINTQKLIDSLKAAGVDAVDIQTSNFSIWQNNMVGPDGIKTNSDYVVDNTVYVTIRKLGSLGALLDTAVKAGANNINSIQFDTADKSKAMSEARAQAVKNAKVQAEELAVAAGVTLGTVQTIQYSDSSPSMVYFDKAMGGGAMTPNASVPINPGQIEVAVSVTMSFEIK